MIGLNTNVLVRYLAQDEPPQSALAEEFIESFSIEKGSSYIGLNLVSIQKNRILSDFDP